ncbi:MAG: tRNA (guanosine(46)-N7)-methyltransferase TrmB [Sphaerochaetaceae bacterium]
MLDKYERVESVSSDGRRSIKSFVLRASKLAGYQKEALELYSEEFVIKFDPNKKLNFREIFGNDYPVIVEIGFGGGETLERLATQMPFTNFVGIEVYINGFTKLLSAVGQKNLTNVRLIRFDAVEVLSQMVEDETLNAIHIFFPDPWPKKRHHKRRLLQRQFGRLLAKKLIFGGYVYVVTDWQDYAIQILEVLGKVEYLHNPHETFAPPKSWRPTTSFERKGIKKRHKIFEIWVEKSRGENLG